MIYLHFYEILIECVIKTHLTNKIITITMKVLSHYKTIKLEVHTARFTVHAFYAFPTFYAFTLFPNLIYIARVSHQNINQLNKCTYVKLKWNTINEKNFFWLRVLQLAITNSCDAWDALKSRKKIYLTHLDAPTRHMRCVPNTITLILLFLTDG